MINVRDCVLVKSGPRQKDIPYIAKVADLWKKDDTGMRNTTGMVQFQLFSQQ